MYVIRIEALEDLARSGCPICRASARVAREWLRGLLRGDDIGDAKVRKTLEAQGGLCPRHVRLLVEVAAEEGDSLGLAIVLEFLLEVAKRELAHRPRQERARRPRRSPLRRGAAPVEDPKNRCGACEAEKRRADAYLALLMDASDDKMQAASDGPRHALCRVHLEQARGADADADADGPGYSGLRLAATRKLDLLLAQVADSIKAHRPGAELPSGVHDVLWRWAPDWLAGPVAGGDQSAGESEPRF
jgi:hypothetical protein